MTQRGRWVSIGDRLLGSQVSKARPGPPFDFCRRSERSNCSPDSPTEFAAPNDIGSLGEAWSPTQAKGRLEWATQDISRCRKGHLGLVCAWAAG